jgi:hypothetical protein
VKLEDRSNSFNCVRGSSIKGLPQKEGGTMFTETYIEMVIKAKEIQDLCKYNKGDWFWNGEKPYLYCKSGLGSSNPHEYKWLPTLEDLFGIWCNLDEATNFAGLCQRITDRKSKIIRYPNIKFIKELCLEAIMKEFYNKSWNGKGWEVIN